MIFDLDGTLADTLESIGVAANKALKEVGLPEHPMENYKYYAGDGADTLIERALIAAGDTKLENFTKAFECYKGIFERDCTYKVKLFEGMKQVTDELKQRGIKIAVLTNKPHNRAIQVIDYLFGEGYMDIVIGESKERPKKPDPSGALSIASLWKVTPSECVYVGDTDVDMQTGKSAGMYTVGVLWGFREREELERYQADQIIDSSKQLLDIIAK